MHQPITTSTTGWCVSVALVAPSSHIQGGMVRRCLIVDSPNSIALVERSPLVVGNRQVLVRPAFVGICGTDLELASGQADPNFVRYPVLLGHEWSGYVVAIGPDCEVEGLSVGDHVVAEGIVPCRTCHRCQAGSSNLCSTYQEIGFTLEGGGSDELLVPSYLVHRLDASVSMLDAALCEPCAVVQRAIMRAQVAEGSRVLVVGDGAIGLLAVHLVRLHGPREVVCLGQREDQASLARAAGATTFTTKVEEAGAGYDVVMEAAGVPQAVTTAIRAAARGGTVVLLGLPPHGTLADMPANEVVYNDLTIFGSFSYTRAAWASVVSMLNAGKINPGIIVSHRFPLHEWARGFDALRGGPSLQGPRGKVLLEVAGDASKTS